MSSQYEVWYVIDNGMLIEVGENDGCAALRKGVKRKRTILCSVEEAKTRFSEKLAEALSNEENYPRQSTQN